MGKDKLAVYGLRKIVMAALVMALATGCAEMRAPTHPAGIYDGPVRNMGAGSIRAFVVLDASGKPTVLGIRMPEAALVGLPAKPPPGSDSWEYAVSLPEEAAISGYDQIVVDWNPKGHIPKGIYDKPHFDFHFYLISAEQREKISARGEDLARAHKAPAPELLPEGYILPEGTEVPHMGAHAIDPTAPEFNKLPFTKTFIYGFYDGAMIFLEPMMTKAFLETKPNVTDDIKLPQTYAKHGYYPTRYSVRYDPSRREYEVAIEGLIYR